MRKFSAAFIATGLLLSPMLADVAVAQSAPQGQTQSSTNGPMNANANPPVAAGSAIGTGSAGAVVPPTHTTQSGSDASGNPPGAQPGTGPGLGKTSGTPAGN